MGKGFLIVLPLGGSWEPLSRMDDFMAEQHVPWAITDNGFGYGFVTEWYASIIPP